MGRGRPRRGDCGSASARKRPHRAVAGEDLNGEDYCFNCKDGGELRVCDFRSCNKAYHPDCVGKDSNFLTSDEEFICEWHTCLICEGRSRYYCFCCPRHAYCKGCVGQAEFIPVLKKTKGFCRDCLRMAVMIEKNVDVDSDGERADFSDRETYEFLFKDYWEIVKEKEGLTLKNLEEAYDCMKKGLNCKQVYLEKVPDEERSSDSDFMGHSDDDDELCSPTYSKGASKNIKKKLKEGRPKKNDHMSWGSEALMEFLSLVGKDTTNSLDQFGAAQVVKDYIRQRNLLQKDKKNLVTCDDKLKSLFRKSKLRYNRICSLLKKHIASNIASEDDTSASSDDNNDSTKTKRFRTANYVSNTSKHTAEIDKRCFASLESDNIKLIYMKRSLVMNLLKQPDTFESKVSGCFVRVKVDPRDYNYYMNKKSHQLGQVTGIRKCSEEYKIRDISTDVLLCIYNMYDVRISMLSDEDFEKDECEDLLLLAQKGSFKRPTVGELEEKARSIHRDIVNHAIDKEILILEKQITMAHEKGWRNEMFASMDKKRLLSEPSERQRRLEEVPIVIPDMKDSNQLQVPTQDKSAQNDMVAFQATKEDADGGTVGMNFQKQGTEDMGPNAAGEIPIAPEQKSEATKADTNGDTSATHVQRQSTEDTEPNAVGEIPRALEQKSEATKADTNGDTSTTHVQRQSTEATKVDTNGDTSAAHGQRQSTEANKSNTAGYTIEKCVQKKDEKAVDSSMKNQVIIDLEADEDLCERDGQTAFIDLEAGDARDSHPVLQEASITFQRKGVSPRKCVWYYVDPQGEEQGPFTMETLRRWWDDGFFPGDFKVWRKGQTSASAVFLRDALYCGEGSR